MDEHIHPQDPQHAAPAPPVFVDNQDGNTLARAITTHPSALRRDGRTPAELCVASACFNPQGLELLARELGHVPRVRLLLGADPTPEALRPRRRPTDPREPEFTRRRLRASLGRMEEALQADRNRIPFELEGDRALRTLLDFLHSGRIEVRRYEGHFLHAKAFLFRGEDRGLLPGSSNLTRAGLQSNLELNLGHWADPLLARAEAWYDALWEEAVPFDLAAIYEQLLAEYPPYLIYLKVLWHLYHEELAEEEEEAGHIPVTTFQRHGVCPASLRDTTWKKFLNDFQLLVECLSYEELAQDPQLGGDHRHLSNPLEDYALVVVDEAHNYRNPDAPTRAGVLRRLLAGKRRDLVLLTATRPDVTPSSPPWWTSSPASPKRPGTSRWTVRTSGRSARSSSSPTSRRPSTGPRSTFAASSSPIHGFAPVSTGALPPDDGDRFDLLLCTDVLAEGMNLQQCRNVINYDLPWNPMRLVQRHGRVDRIGSPHREVYLRTFFPDRQLDALLNLEQRVRRKLAQAAASVGVEVAPIELGAQADRSFAETRQEIERLRREDASLYEAGGTEGAAQTGEEYRQELRKALARHGETIEKLPWRIGSGLARGERSGHVFCAAAGERVYLRFVPLSEDEEVIGEIGGCLKLIECDEDTPSALSAQLAARAYGAWSRARQSIFDAWMFETDPANLQPKVRRLNREVAEFLRAHPHPEIDQQRLERCLNAVEAPWPRREENELRKAWSLELDPPEDKSKRLVEAIERIGAEPYEPPEPLPPVQQAEIQLVCWPAIAQENPEQARQ